MSENKPLVYLAIALIVTLVALTAYWCKTEKKNPRPEKVVRYAPVERTTHPDSIDYDFVSMIDSQENSRVPAEYASQTHPFYQDRAVRLAGYPNQAQAIDSTNGMFRPQANVPLHSFGRTAPSGASHHFATSAPRSAATATSSSARGSRAAGYTNSYGATPGASAGGVGAYAGPNETNAYQEALAKERNQVLDSFTPKQTRQQQKALQQQLQAMSAGIDRAIAKAVMPKSKREKNIEKYLAPGGNAAQAGGQTASSPEGEDNNEVVKQIANQAKQVVGNMKQAYGDSAASQASQIMDNFQTEMANELTKPGDPQEKQIRATAINNKYNEKLQKLNRQEGFKKMENQLRAENEKMLSQIRTTFNPETEAAARAIMEENLKKRMEIMSGGYAEEEAYQRLLALDEQQRKDLEQIVRQHNPNDIMASSKLQQLHDQIIQGQIDNADQAVREGKQQAQQFRVNEKTLQEMNNAWKKENNELIAGMEAYGPQVQQQATQILDQLRAKRMELISQGGDLNVVNRKNMELTEQANKALEQLRQKNQKPWIENITAKMNEQNTEILQQYTSHMQGIPQEVKEQWSQSARPILEKYNALRAQVLSQAATNPKYEEELKRIDEQQQEELMHITLDEPAAK